METLITTIAITSAAWTALGVMALVEGLVAGIEKGITYLTKERKHAPNRITNRNRHSRGLYRRNHRGHPRQAERTEKMEGLK